MGDALKPNQKETIWINALFPAQRTISFPPMYIITIVIFCSVLGAAYAEDGCVREENCTLTESDRGIWRKTCDGYAKGDCHCTQLRSVNFEFDCYCCSKDNSTRTRRDVSLEAMFGLKSYKASKDAKTTDSIPSSVVLDQIPPTIDFRKTRLTNDSCGELEYADPDRMTSELSVSVNELKNVTIRSTHATTLKNCWNICKFDVLSSNQLCNAVGFIEANSQKPTNDCYILSDSPINSTGKDASIKIYEICV